jgi:hypothetical protein
LNQELEPVPLPPAMQYALRAAFLFGGVPVAHRTMQHYLGGEPRLFGLSLVPHVSLMIATPIRPELIGIPK